MIQIEDGRKQFFQWDTGRMISFAGKCEQFHFQKKQFGRTVDVDASFDGEKSSCKVPDFLLQISGKFSVYAFIGTAEDGYTKIEKEFDVIARNKPADYVFTPQEQQTIKDAQKYADEAKASAETAVNASGVSTAQANRAKSEADRAQKIVDDFKPEGGGGGVTDHADLAGRDQPNQHPMEAITGLETALAGKQPKGDYITQEADPTVPEWAKQPKKPTYTAAEVGALPKETKIPDVPEWALKPQKPTYKADEVGAIVPEGLTAEANVQAILEALNAKPGGGGGWEVITEKTLEQDGNTFSNVVINKNDKGEPFEYSEIRIQIYGDTLDGLQGNVTNIVINDAIAFGEVLSPGNIGNKAAKYIYEFKTAGGMIECKCIGGTTDRFESSRGSRNILMGNKGFEKISSIAVSSYINIGGYKWGFFPIKSGGKIEIYGKN